MATNHKKGKVVFFIASKPSVKSNSIIILHHLAKLKDLQWSVLPSRVHLLHFLWHWDITSIVFLFPTTNAQCQIHHDRRLHVGPWRMNTHGNLHGAMQWPPCVMQPGRQKDPTQIQTTFSKLLHLPVGQICHQSLPWVPDWKRQCSQEYHSWNNRVKFSVVHPCCHYHRM